MLTVPRFPAAFLYRHWRTNRSTIDTTISIIHHVSKAQKLLDAMANNPLDWKIDQVQTVAKAFGLTVHSPGGSHHIVRHANGGKVSVPAHRPIHAVYIKQFVRLVKFGKGDNE